MIIVNGKSLSERKQEAMAEMSSLGAKVKKAMSEVTMDKMMGRLKKMLSSTPKLRL